MIAHRQFTSAEEMRAHAAAVHAKCFGKPPRKPKLVIVPKPVESAKGPYQPLWGIATIRFDAHVQAYRENMCAESMTGANKVKRYIRDRAVEMGSTYMEVMSFSRKRPLVRMRDIIFYEIKTYVKPDISYPELGRVFAGRDHSSILASYRRGAGYHGDQETAEVYWRKKDAMNNRYRETKARASA